MLQRKDLIYYKSELGDYKSVLGDFKLSQLSLNSECTRYYSTGIKMKMRHIFLRPPVSLPHPLLAGYPQIQLEYHDFSLEYA